VSIIAANSSQDSFLFGVPLVYIALSADVGSNVPEPQGLRAPINQFAHYRTFPDTTNREVVGPNLDTLYSFAWLDLSEEPLVLSVPEMGDRYWNMMVLDAWNDVPTAPGSRTVGGKGGNFAIVGPNWSGEIPEDLTAYRISSNIGAIGGRTYTTGTADVPVQPGVDASKTIPAQVMGMSAEVFFNWLPAPEGEIGFLALRLYVPKQQVIDGIWKPQPVMRESNHEK